VAEPKREEEKIFSYDTGEPPSSEPSVLGDDPPPGGSAPGEESDLAVQVARLRAEKEDLLQTLVRRQADFENYRKRVERDRHDEARRGVERLIADLIPVLDGFDRALQALADQKHCGNKSAAIREVLYKEAGMQAKLRMSEKKDNDSLANAERRSVKYGSRKKKKGGK